MEILYHPLYWSLLAFNSMICGTIGYYIGKRKNRIADGVAWGVVFGWIGVIIASLLNDNQDMVDTRQSIPASAYRIVVTVVMIILFVVILYQLTTTV